MSSDHTRRPEILQTHSRSLPSLNLHLFNMAPKKVKVVQENVSTSLGPNIKEGELVFGVARIFASFNDVSFLLPLDYSYHADVMR